MQKQQPIACRGAGSRGELNPPPARCRDDACPCRPGDSGGFVRRAAIDNDDLLHQGGGLQLLYEPWNAWRPHSALGMITESLK